MSNTSVQNESFVEQSSRFKTNSDPTLKTDRFIPLRKSNQSEISSPSIFCHQLPIINTQFDYEDFDNIFEKQFFGQTDKVRTRESPITPFPIENNDFETTSSFFKNTSSFYSYKSLGIQEKKPFRLPKKPLKILDLPGMEDDYYTNLLDWSIKDQIAICLENKIYSYDYNTSKTIEIYEAFSCEAISSLCYNHDGSQLVFGNILGQIFIWDIEKQAEVHVFNSHSDRIGCIDWKTNGVISGSKDKTAIFNDPRIAKTKSLVICAHSQEICGIRWNNEQSLIATGGNDNKVCIWDFSSQKKIMTGCHESGVKALAWSQKQYGILATGGGTNDRCLKVWNTNTQSLEYERNVEAQICSLIYSKLTNDVISGQGSDVNDIRIWRSNGLKKVGVLSGHTLRPLHLALSPNGSILASASPDETMRFWKIIDEKRFENEEVIINQNKDQLKNDVNLLR